MPGQLLVRMVTSAACDIGTLGVVGKSDAEEEMVRFPWDVLTYEYRTDAHGAGKWRGAPGVTWEAVNESGVDCECNGGPWSGFSTQAPGQQGGQPTPLNTAYVLRGKEKLFIKTPHIPTDMKDKDHLVTLSGGGAGVGRPEERDLEAVRLDVKNELVSLKMAKEVYKVVINPNTLEIDQKETQKLRGKTKSG